jgi:hypothetical protein
MNMENDSVFNVYFSNFLVTRYRQDVVYSWKGLLGKLLNIYMQVPINSKDANICIYNSDKSNHIIFV